MLNVMFTLLVIYTGVAWAWSVRIVSPRAYLFYQNKLTAWRSKIHSILVFLRVYV